MTEAKYIDIKRFAVHDGPGIRTTLFLKGCSLHCIWCHNPESRRKSPELAYYSHKCSLCGKCSEICSCHKIIGNQHIFDRNSCIVCGKCEDVCNYSALELFGKNISVSDAAAKLLEDRIFYSNGGGITLSGGEPLLESDFCCELLKIMKKENIHCAVDTCGNVPWSAFEKVIPYTDIFLYDFKCADSEKHRKFTGSGNELIIENLRKLNDSGKKTEIRMLMIPGLNMSVNDIAEAGEILAPMKNITAIRLLAYHSMARAKFAAVGHIDTMPDTAPPTADELEKSAEILRSYGLEVINSLYNNTNC